MDEVTIKLPNGLVLTGTREQIIYTARALGFANPFVGEYYNSITQGLIRIDEMNTRHLRNAVLKMLRENKDENGTIWRNMVKEYFTRELSDPEE